MSLNTKEIEKTMKTIKLPYVEDPVTKQPSVSLTLVVISVLAVVVVGILMLTKVVDQLGPFEELMYSALALYFGRRIQFNGKTIDQESK